MAKSCMELCEQKWAEEKFVCVGLDTSFEQLPEHIRNAKGSIGAKIKNFNSEIILATRDIASAYKYNFGFYLGVHRLWALEESIRFSQTAAPDVPIILDWKAGDIGSTLREYARYAFEEMGVDAVTVNPWGGKADGIDVFFEYRDKLIFVWCAGSNRGSAEIQDLMTGNRYEKMRIFESLARKASVSARDGWNYNQNCGLVVGADSSDHYCISIYEARSQSGRVPFLIPGIGKQGGDLYQAVTSAIYMDPESKDTSFPAIINSSRSIIYASSGLDFAEAAREKTGDLNIRILSALEDIGCGIYEKRHP